MPIAVPDLWPESFGDVQQLTPIAILREQGQRLAHKTRNLVVAEVRSERLNAVGEPFTHRFVVSCPVLAFTRPLLEVTHDIEPYPVKVVGLLKPETRDRTGRARREGVEAKDAEAFMAAIQKVFSESATVALIRSLVTQARDFSEH